MKEIIKSGDRYKKIVAVKFKNRDNHGNQYWLFRCDCGKEKVIRVNSVKNGDTKSCGCLMRESGIKHGKSYKPVYQSWRAMKKRCLNKNHPAYKNYGGRGITVCDEWMDFQNFYRDMGERPKGKTLDRIKNNLGYCKENCKWSNWEQQQNNRRSNHLLTYRGKTMNVTQWAKRLGVSSYCIFERLKRGWTIEKILSIK